MDISGTELACEQDRLDALDSYDVLDTPSEEAFDRITRLARRLFDVPMSTITFIDGHRQWFKSRQGVAVSETAKAPALCYRAIQRTEALVVPDLAADERFQDNPLVTGEPHLRFYAGMPLRSPEGHALGTLCAMDTKPRSFGPDDIGTLVDLASLAMDILEHRRQATTDALTGSLSRRAFRRQADRDIALARRHRHDLSCLLLDIDRFKDVNDTHGHAAGDDVLRACVEACRTQLRDSDIVGRWGGEEFAILLPLTGSAGAIEVAERVRLAVSRVRVAVPEGEVGVTASIGTATLDRSTDGIENLLSRADQALYGAKRDGRDRCHAWQPVHLPQTGLRRRVLKAGLITFNAGRSTIDCTIRSLSDTEAGLDIVSSAGIPDDFKLRIESDGLSRQCRVLVKRDRHLEVAFG